MKKTRWNAGHTTVKTDQQNLILDRLFDYFSHPKGHKPTAENDVEVSFYKCSLNALPKNFHDNTYNGVNIIMLLQYQKENSIKVPIYATFKQVADLLEQYKNQLPKRSDYFDPNKPLKGLKLDAQIVKYLETYKKDGEKISKNQFESATEGLSLKQIQERGYQKRNGLKPYNVFPIEKIKHLLPQVFIDEREYFAEQEALEQQRMTPEMQDLLFVEKAQLIIEAIGVPVIESYQDRAYYLPNKHQIIIPPRSKFQSDKAYFAVILHELSHSTSRDLGRDINHAFGSVGYMKEELIAETATLFMCLEEGLDTFNAHAQYLESWASHFEDKKKVLLSVCKQARDAQKYISDKVIEHKQKLANQPKYVVPNNIDSKFALTEKYTEELAQFIAKEANTFGCVIPLKGQKIIGFNRISEGIEVFSEEKSVKLQGAAAMTFKRKLSELEMKQSLFNEEITHPCASKKPDNQQLNQSFRHRL